MSAAIEKTEKADALLTKTSECAPIRMKTWSELGEYLARHLTPVRRGPKGQPIYAQEDMAALNIIWPDED